VRVSDAIKDPAINVTSIRVSVVGAAGRMGSEVCRAVEAAADLRLVGRYDQGDELGDLGGADVVVEFSVPDASAANVAYCIDRGTHVVVGTTGWTDGKLAGVRSQLTGKPGVGVLIAPNFAIGAILMMSFAQQAARFYESVEIVELHHPDKVDAPSGTAARTASLIARARQDADMADVSDATTSDPGGARGARVDGIPVHALRLRGLVAHQEVLLGAAGELLTIRHDSFDRISFMPGVLAGVRQVADHPGLTVGLESYLGLACVKGQHASRGGERLHRHEGRQQGNGQHGGHPRDDRTVEQLVRHHVTQELEREREPAGQQDGGPERHSVVPAVRGGSSPATIAASAATRTGMPAGA
jgi:4-hydroxy-tetrahydrodipicolinate reductase